MSIGTGAVQRERWEAVYRLLHDLNGLDPLKQLFWTELNYERVNQPIPRRDWPKAAREALAEDPVLFAEAAGLQIIYGRLHSPGRLRQSANPSGAARIASLPSRCSAQSKTSTCTASSATIP
jgi:hypothetical protein